MRNRSDYNKNWFYKALEYSKDALNCPETIGTDFECVNVPHDAAIHDTDEFYRDKVFWYAKKIGFTPEEDRNYILYFEGVYMDASVWINGTDICDWPDGYTSFWVDVTPYISSEDDLILVRIVYRNPNSRWYAGPGIVRNVWLYDMPDRYILPDGIAVGTSREDNLWKIEVDAVICDKESCPEYVFGANKPESIDRHNPDIGLELYDNSGVLIAESRTSELLIDDPRLWSDKIPYLYLLRVILYKDDTVSDSDDINIGFRELEFTSDSGLYINGEHTKLKGVCLHDDFGALGHAFHPDAARRQIKLMKEMGANAIRVAHNPPAPGFLDICDELGMLVLDEIFDCWKKEKNPFDYGRFFDEWHEKDVKAWIERDRNHPSVIMWSVGNEIYDTHASKDGMDTMLHLMELVEKYDIYKHAPATLCSNYMAWENTQACADKIKLIGYNYTERLYDEHHKAHPDWIIYGSETSSVVQSRGIYHFPLSQSILSDDDMQCSSLGNSSTSWGAKTQDQCIATERDKNFSLGQFIWSGIDYIGEPTPYHTKNSYFGLADTACFPKDAYYLYKAQWTENRTPVIHLLPYWDFNPGQLIDIRVCSNMHRVELFKDGESLGSKYIDHEKGISFYADFRTVYSDGFIEAKAYDEAGKCLVSERRESFGDVEKLCLSQDTFEVSEGEDSLFFVEITALDEQNRLVENANCRVDVSVEGQGFLAGLDNGDSTDNDSYKGESKRMFSGKLLAIVRSNGQRGHIRVKASVNKTDIPVRKLEIVSTDGFILTPDEPTTIITAALHPANAVFDDITWQITNEAGVKIKKAVVEKVNTDGLGVKIRALGDGEFKVRALVKDENKKTVVISVLDMTAKGFGKMYTDPYEFVSGSLYDRSEGDVGNGNEKGVSTSRTQMCLIAYDNLDFGENGAKRVTIPIFELDNKETEIIFWKGFPYAEDSRICGRGVYNKPSKWNVYQEETFELDEVLKGVQTFGIELHHKIHIKGFCFERYNRARQINEAAQADEIYGDAFRVTGESVEDIGNNVSLVFKNMDFGSSPIKGIKIYGRTLLEKNTIHILFEKDGCAVRQIIEFPYCEEYTEYEFELEEVEGVNDVTFIFLPGSHFDFGRFIFR